MQIKHSPREAARAIAKAPVKFFRSLTVALFVASFGLSGTGAFAADFDLGSFSAPASMHVGNTMLSTISETGWFEDTYSFSVTSDASLAGVLAAIQFLNIVGIDDFSSSLYLGGELLATGDTTVTEWGNGVGSTTTSSLYYTPLLAGSPSPIYQVRAVGTVVGLIGSYGGALILSPVPEPEIYAMMAVGMGLIGWASRQKKRRQAVPV